MKKKLGKLKNVQLRDIWEHEGTDFTPWLEENIRTLGDALGLDLEIIEREASVGDFSLDLLAEDIGSSKKVIIENQLERTDHDHLGKLLTYASGFDASIVIWVSKEVRDEHRQALDWLNQKTDMETQFFAVEVEILQIDDSSPACKFKPVVLPNGWQKLKRQQISGNTSARGEKYREYFQGLIDILREKHQFTDTKQASFDSWHGFLSGIARITCNASFTRGGKTQGKARTEIRINLGNQEKNKRLFDNLRERAAEITESYGSPLEWERLDDSEMCRIAIYRDGSVESDDLEEIRQWHVENLLMMKKVFVPEIKKALKELSP